MATIVRVHVTVRPRARRMVYRPLPKTGGCVPIIDGTSWSIQPHHELLQYSLNVHYYSSEHVMYCAVLCAVCVVLLSLPLDNVAFAMNGHSSTLSRGRQRQRLVTSTTTSKRSLRVAFICSIATTWMPTSWCASKLTSPSSGATQGRSRAR